jgi:nicotinamidase-related amidase
MPVEDKNRQRSLAEKTDPRKTALVVIDMQNDFCHADGFGGKRGGDMSAVGPTAERIGALVDEARRLDMLIIWVRAHYDPITMPATMAEVLEKFGGGERCIAGTWGADWFGDLVPKDAANEVTISKHRYDAFYDTPIDILLRANAIENIVATGTSTDVCVESTVRDAFFHNYFVVMPEDASCARPVGHIASMDIVGKLFGVTPKTDDVLALWKDCDAKGPRGWHADQKAKAALTDFSAIIDPAHTALVIVDMQNDFCHGEGVMAKFGADLSTFPDAIAANRDLLGAARQSGAMVIHVHGESIPLARSPNLRGLVSEKKTVSQLVQAGSWGAEIIEELAPLPNEETVPKFRYSGFVETRLETLLRSNGIRTIIVTGTATQTCVESTVRDGQMRDYRVIVPEEAVCSRGLQQHLRTASLETMNLYFADVTPTAQILSVWNAPANVAIGNAAE